LKDSLIAYPAFRYKQLGDLLKLCSDNNPDVVLKATAALSEIFLDILPSYRIREYNQEDEKTKKEGKKDNHRISKDV
jgi:hypothetical protein